MFRLAKQTRPLGRALTLAVPFSSSSSARGAADRALHWKAVGAALTLGAAYQLASPFISKRAFGEENAQPPLAAEAGEPKQEDEAPRRPLEPLYYDYVTVGSGTAAFSALHAIRSRDPYAQVLMIAKEDEYPYNRTPLTKELWHSEDPEVAQNLSYKKWNGKESTVFYQTPDFFLDAQSEEAREEQRRLKELQKTKKKGEGLPSEELNHVKLIRSNPAVSINPDAKLIILQNDQKVYYDKLLLATGATPRQLPIFQRLPEQARKYVSTYRSLADFREIEEKTKEGNQHIVIIGGGFLGSELACSLAHRAKSVPGLKVTQIFPEDGNMAHVFPKYLSDWATDKIRQEGVQVLPGSKVVAVSQGENGLTLHLGTKNDSAQLLASAAGEGERSAPVNQIVANHVIVSVGVRANIGVGKRGGLEVDDKVGGFLVNAELEARRDVFVAGDACSYYDTVLSMRRRVEHYEHAVVSGRIAGENMTGARKPYKYIPMFWSDLGPNIGFEAVGLVDSSLETVGVWSADDSKAPSSLASPATTPPPEASEAASELSAEPAAVPPSPESSPETSATSPEVGAQADGPSFPASLEQQPPAAQGLDPQDKYSKGVVYYLRDKKVVGVLTWNLFNKMSVAREIIKRGETFDDFSELTKLIKLQNKPLH